MLHVFVTHSLVLVAMIVFPILLGAIPVTILHVLVVGTAEMAMKAILLVGYCVFAFIAVVMASSFVHDAWTVFSAAGFIRLITPQWMWTGSMLVGFAEVVTGYLLSLTLYNRAFKPG